MHNKYEKVKKLLIKYNQEHLLEFYNELTKIEQDNLINQILRIDFEQVLKLYEGIKTEVKLEDNVINPIEYINKEKLLPNEINTYKVIGEDVIRNNHFAVITMAGGQRNTFRT